MNLADRCRQLRLDVEKQQEALLAFAKSKALRARADELKAIREAFSIQLSRLEVLRSKGVAVGALPETSSASEIVAEYVKTLEDASDAQNSGAVKRSLAKLVKSITDVVESALASVEKSLPSFDESFLKQVELIPEFAARVSRIRAARRQLTSGVSLRQMGATELGAFLDRRAELGGLADELNPNEIPAEVLEFFRSVRYGGAPLEKLTDGVKQWLAGRGQLKSLRVILKT